MKNVFMTIIMLCIYGTLFAGNEITEQKTIKVGQAFKVSMESKPSSGMRWRWAKKQNPLVDSVRMTCVNKALNSGSYSANSGNCEEVWTFRATTAGTDTVTLYYKSHWDVNPVVVKKVCLTILPD